MPELSYHYHLSPEEVWALTPGQFAAYLRHHKAMRQEADNG